MFSERSFMSYRKDENSVKAVIKNKNGQECYQIHGKYTESLFVKDLTTNKEWCVFKAPATPANHELMYNMNLYSLQLMVLSDELRSKIPPTDGRLRGDTKYWDVADLDLATKEKDRLERNQRSRRA